MRQLLTTICLTGAIATAVFAGTAQAQTTLRFGHVLEPSHPLTQEFQRVANEIAEKTDGEVQIELFPASQLGSQPELIEALSLGTVDITAPGSAFLGTTVPRISVTSAPYVFCNLDHFVAYSQSDAFNDLSQVYTDETGNHILGMWYYGRRHLTANRKVTEPSDAQGLKIRVPNAPIYSMFPEQIGANPTPIAFSEVYLALQQGVVDGQENPLPVIQAKRFYEVQSYVNLTGHMIDNLMPVISSFGWDKLTDDQKDIVSEAFASAARNTVDLISQRETEIAKELQDTQTNVVEVDKQAFADAMRPALTGDDVAWTDADYKALRDTAPEGACSASDG